MKTNQDNSRTLWVLWSPIPSSHVPMPVNGDVVLSFLPPLEEDQLPLYPCTVLLARELIDLVKEMARNTYVQICAHIGLAKVGRGETLRQALTPTGESVSRWWFHHTSFKDSETQSTYTHLIAAFTVDLVAKRHNLSTIHFVGAPEAIVDCLKHSYRCSHINLVISRRSASIVFRGMGSRIVYGFRVALHVMVCRWLFRKVPLPERLDVGLMGFWNWSLAWDESSKRLDDKYFKDLPLVLADSTLSKVGWFLWLDPFTPPRTSLFSFAQWLRPLRKDPRCVVLQRLLTVFELPGLFLNFRPLRIFLALQRERSFHELFTSTSLDLYPLFRDELLSGFANSTIPLSSLVERATARASLKLKPTVSISFLEHFLHARAFYSGVRAGHPPTVQFAVQHGSYNSEKTLLALDPLIEFRGNPDNLPVPHPDAFFAMGELTKRLAQSCGYAPDDVIATGSPRFSQLSKQLSMTKENPIQNPGRLNVLVVTGFADEPDLDVLAATWISSKDLPGISIRLRKHPFSRMSPSHPKLSPFLDRVQVSHHPLDVDLAFADVILFTYSTVAEEACVLGYRVWQWVPLGFNGSGLTEISSVPTFTSVQALRDALGELVSTGKCGLDTPLNRSSILKELFYRGDGLESVRIADTIVKRIRTAMVLHSPCSKS